MFSNDGFLGCPRGVAGLMAQTDKLNALVVEQVNDSQELMMLNSFAQEVNEYQFKMSLQDRISDIASWTWVLGDLSKRLDEAIGTLRHEHMALRVVVHRIKCELNEHSREGCRPGALNPMTDTVEDAINQEYNFLREQKKNFENLILKIEAHITSLLKTKDRINDDVSKKQSTISMEQSCGNINLKSISSMEKRDKKTKRKGSLLNRWENRCMSLKSDGLRALSNAVIIRQQVRGARNQLSIAAQAYGARVDSILRRRLHANKTKLQELQWQREEAVRDLKSLEDEMLSTEQSLLDNMAQERVVEARLADRTLRPSGELTRDDVNKKLKEEFARLRLFVKNLRNNIERITSLQNHLKDSIIQIDCCAEDIVQIVRLDEERSRSRNGEESNASDDDKTTPSTCKPPAPTPSFRGSQSSSPERSGILNTIKEVDEDDECDYPFAE